MKELLKNILSNQCLVAAALSWFIAQLIKIIVELSKRTKFRTRDFILRALVGTGGMPSSHTATVTAVTVGIAFEHGVTSSIFAFACIFTFVTIRDATGVRLSAGHQAHSINQIISSIPECDKIKKVKEVRGHTVIQCFVGMLIGLLVSLGLFLF
ncbi:MAG: divergent PAP2 family protein [Spirochaetota bacterium]|nr:divergent PAP2 family protein [Spirochaetota bacterium]